MAARKKPEITLDTAAVAAVVREATAKIEAVLRQELQRRVDEAVSTALGRVVTRAAPAAARRASPTLPATGALGSGGRPRRMCPVPGCPNYAAGPKYAWRCRDHKTVSKDAILRMKGAADAGPVKVRVIKAKEAPGERKRGGPPMDCRMPGCSVKSRGPRYDFFCADHYRELNADDRRKYADLWKENREKAKAAPKAPGAVVIVRKAVAAESTPAPAPVEAAAAPAPALEATPAAPVTNE